MAGSTCLWAVMWIFGSRTTKNVFSGEGLRNCCGPLACNPLPNHLFRNRGNGTFEDVTGMCCKDWKRDKQRLGRRGIAGELRGCCGLAMIGQAEQCFSRQGFCNTSRGSKLEFLKCLQDNPQLSYRGAVVRACERLLVRLPQPVPMGSTQGLPMEAREVWNRRKRGAEG